MDVIEGRFFISGRFEECCIGIEGGKIVKISKVLEAEKIRRFGSLSILPGAVDAHVHFREPGMTAKEDFGSGSNAAIHGGVTCVFDMPNTVPATTTLAALREKRRLASSKSMVDFGLYAGVRQGIDVPALAKEAVGFKLYMAGTTPEMQVPSLSDISSELSAIASSGKVLAVHAEDERLRKKEPEKDLDDHLRNRFNECESSAIRKVKEAAKKCGLHICHVSAKDSIPLIENAKGLTSEVTPHHLLLDKNSKVGSHAKVNPPLRKREDRHALFKALQSETFDIVASDHAPHTLEEKAEEFDYAPSGMPGVETMVPLLLHLVDEKHLDLANVVSRVCTRPGEIFGIPKGKIAVDYDADLMVVDFSQCIMVRADHLHSKCGWSAFEGMPAIFPKIVLLRGETVLENGKTVGKPIGRDVIAAAK